MRWPAVRLESRVLSAEIEYSRSRYFGDGSEYSRAEYARRRSNTLDPDISKMVRNNQEPRTLDGDQVLSVPRFSRRDSLY